MNRPTFLPHRVLGQAQAGRVIALCGIFILALLAGCSSAPPPATSPAAALAAKRVAAQPVIVSPAAPTDEWPSGRHAQVVSIAGTNAVVACPKCEAEILRSTGTVGRVQGWLIWHCPKCDAIVSGH